MFKRLAVALLLTASPVFAAQPTSQNLIVPLGGAPQILIPAAGAVEGANGTFFRSDITLLNYAAHDQRVRFRWLPNGVNGNTVPPRDTILPALTGVASEDFVTTVLQQTGLGSILITGINVDGTIDQTARLYATSRIWSNQPGLSSGTVSQTFSTLTTNDINNTKLSLLGLKRDDRYRLNVGIVNLDQTNEQTFVITTGGAGQGTQATTVTVPPLSMVQSSIVGTAFTNLQIIIQNSSTPVRTNTWVAYGSSVDNVTGDSWSEIAYTAAPDVPVTSP